MRIAILSSLFPPYALGGAEQLAAQLASALAALGHDVDVISTCDRSDLDGARFRQDTWDGIRVWRVAPWNLYWRFAKDRDRPGRLARAAWHAVDLWNPSVFGPLRAVLDRIRPQVIHTHNIDGFSPAVWQVARRYGPVVHTLHDYHLVCPRATMRRADGTMCERLCAGCGVYARYHTLFARSVRVLVTPSSATGALHQQYGWRAPSLEIIPNAVDTPEFEPEPAEGPLRVLFLSRLEREKGCETLLTAIPGAPEVEFHVAGRGPYQERFAELAQRARNMKWHGFVIGGVKRDLFSQCDVFLQISECRENAPLALIEAKQYGLYTIGTPLGGIPEMIPDAQMGCLIPAASPNKLLDILRSLSSEAVRQGRAERIRRAAGYGTREMAAAYLRVYRSALSLSS